jgi:Chaperone of endosialidase
MAAAIRRPGLRLALVHNTLGGFNTPNGAFALQNNITGSNNTAVGFGALINNTGIANIGVGLFAGDFVTSANNVICIGTGLSGANVSDSCFIDNIRGVTAQNANAISVVIDSAGQLGTMSSSRRFKKEVKPMDNTSEAILGLKPVTFHYENDKTDTPQFGLIAEEVAEVNPDLVVRDERGEIYSVRYDAVNAMLLNEFLKEHEAFVEEHLKVQQQKKEIDVLKTELKEQRALIQKVSDRIELKSSTSQIVANDQ